ncbi:MAG: SpoIIE family protein phosphatase [Bacteroidota bacterium]
MKPQFNNHKYWILAGIVLFAVILILYPLGIYNSLTFETTRAQAIKIAEEFLKKQKINIDGFHKEAFIENYHVENKYFLKKLGTDGFKKIQQSKNWLTRSWYVYLHQNLSKELPQTSYSIIVSHDGRVMGFKQTIPNTKTIKSLKEEEATALITDYLKSTTGLNLAEYSLVESKQENLGTRVDYTFKWEKKSSRVEGKFIIQGYVHGDQIGGYWYSFEVPEANRKYFETSEALFGTASVIFVIFLMMVAFFLFLKKYHQGEVWFAMGRNLFIIYFILSLLSLINYWPGIGKGVGLGNLSFLNTKIIVLVINGAIVYFFIGLLVFASWTVGESYARSLWPEKLKGIDGFVKGHLTSVATGSSLFRGMILGTGYALINLIAALVLNVPNADIFISPNKLLGDIYSGYFPAAAVVLESFTLAALSSIAISFFIINISYQRWKKKWISILFAGLVTMLGSVIAETPPSLNNFLFDLLLYFFFGCAVGYIYFLFDILTIGSMFFHAGLISKGFVLFAGANSFYQINFVIVVIVFLATPVIYVISRFKKKEFVLENYGLPSHIQRISERERLKKELEIAAKVQLSLIPKEEPKIPGYDISAISIPAIEAGGDYFDFVKLSGGKIGIAIGDVSGKGIGAAIYMTLTKGILQAHAEEDVSPKNVLAKVNRLLYKTIEKNSFVSMFYAILDTNRHTILYSRAGHNPGILCSQEGGKTKLLLSRGMALGLEEGHIFTSTLNEEEIILQVGDLFILYTDGFTEAMNEKHEQYGEERMIKLIEGNRNLTSRDLLNLILKDVKRFVSNYPQHDDMTILVVKRINLEL